jgi:pimeloyl-ACP methyl ester carboxylesterase
LTSCGVDVTAFDYRGYGRSTGKPTVALMAADGVRAFDKVNATYPGRVIVHGQSLGSFIAAHVARERPQAHGLVMESTSSTVQEWADARLPWFMRATTTVAVEPILRDVDTVKAAASYKGPALVMVGTRDKITPARLARKVFDALPTQSKLWVEAQGAGHNDVLGNAAVMPAYCGFINSLK